MEDKSKQQYKKVKEEIKNILISDYLIRALFELINSGIDMKFFNGDFLSYYESKLDDEYLFDEFEKMKGEDLCGEKLDTTDIIELMHYFIVVELLDQLGDRVEAMYN